MTKIRDERRQTDRQMETGGPFLGTLRVMKDPENVKVESRPKGLDYNTSFTFAQEVKSSLRLLGQNFPRL